MWKSCADFSGKTFYTPAQPRPKSYWELQSWESKGWIMVGIFACYICQCMKRTQTFIPKMNVQMLATFIWWASRGRQVGLQTVEAIWWLHWGEVDAKLTGVTVSRRPPSTRKAPKTAGTTITGQTMKILLNCKCKDFAVQTAHFERLVKPCRKICIRQWVKPFVQSLICE